jgi:hypothetical protein
MAFSTLTFSSRSASASKRARRLHRRQRQELHGVVLDHVAQAAALLVVAGARADPEVLGHRDLHAVDEVAVPDRLEDRVGEALDQQVLHRLLAEVVVDPIHLVLLEHRAEVALSARAESRSLPNGFSMMTFEWWGLPR